ncbi:MAG: fluoride efflux transporter CrcB [Gemmatimonadaceae bacterium]
MILHIALGSALGGVARYVIAGWVQRASETPFPTGTMLVNVTGSLLLGVLARTVLVAPGISPEMRALLAVGFCGGYTTFSTFSLETVQLLEKGQIGRAGLYAVASVVLSLGALWLGYVLASGLFGVRAFPGNA